MPIIPYIRTPLSDLTGVLLTHQGWGKCAELEMQLMNCYEAYGYDLGQRKCYTIIEDFRECLLMNKQVNRVLAMKKEREKQGLGPAPPPAFDSFQCPVEI